MRINKPLSQESRILVSVAGSAFNAHLSRKHCVCAANSAFVVHSQQMRGIDMDKRDIAEVFRERLALVASRAGLNLSQLAEGIALDRSALSQMLSGRTTRLPRAETLLRLAARHNVSLDWLLGLSQDEALTAELAPAFALEQAGPDGDDPLLARWHSEAAGTKIRYVPSALPDLLRNEEIIAFDAKRTGVRVEAGLSEMQLRVDYNRRPETDMEVCMPRQTMEAFANGDGYWADLPKAARLRQLEHMARLIDDLYPTFRLFLFDGGATFSAPFTVFGPRRAAIYLGDAYLVLNARDAVASLARRFDQLVRMAVIHAHEAPGWCRELALKTHA
jgi:transcriptional regulator with XRE-family HTH domain